MRVKVIPDTSDFVGDLRDDLIRIKRRIGDMKIKVTGDLDQTSFHDINALIDKILDQHKTVKVKGRWTGFGGSGGGRGGLRGLLNNPYVIAAAVLAVSAAVSPLVGGLVVAAGVMAGMAGSAAAMVVGMDGVKRLVEDINPDFKTMRDNVSDAVWGALYPLVDALNDIRDVIIPGMQGLAEAIGPTSLAISQVLHDAHDSGQLQRIFDGMKQVMIDLAPLIGLFVQYFLDFIEFVLPFVGPAIEEITQAFEDSEPSWEALGELIPLAVADFTALIVLIIRWLPVVIAVMIVWSKVSQAIIFGIASLFLGLYRVLEVYITGIIDLVMDMKRAYEDAGGGIRGYWEALKVAIVGGAQVMLRTFGELVAQVGNALAVIVERILWVTGIWTDAGQTWPATIRRTTSNIRRQLQGLADDLPRILASAAHGVARAADRIMRSFMAALQVWWGRIQMFFASLTAKIPKWKGPESVDRKLLRRPADLIMDGFLDQIGRRFDDVKNTFGSLPIEAGAMALPSTSAMGGVTQQFTIDPTTQRSYVEQVALAASRGANKALGLRYAGRA